jgi:hypothetical protein
MPVHQIKISRDGGGWDPLDFSFPPTLVCGCDHDADPPDSTAAIARSYHQRTRFDTVFHPKCQHCRTRERLDPILAMDAPPDLRWNIRITWHGCREMDGQQISGTAPSRVRRGPG